MKTKILIFLFVLLSSVKVNSQDSLMFSVHFKTNQFTLDSINSELIYKNCDSLINLQAEIIEICIYGHTDNVGSENFNLKLSQKRIATIQTEIFKRFKSDSIVVNPFGESMPIESNLTKKGKSLNRRVDITLIYRKKETPPIAEIVPDYDLYKQLSAGFQIFKINPKQDTVLLTKNNTLVYIQKNSFDLTGIATEIIFKIKEIYNKSDMVLEDLSTTSDNEILTSYGMFKIEPEYNGKPVNVLPNKPITVFAQTPSIDYSMQFFTGETDNRHHLNWNPDSNGNFSILNSTYFYPCNSDNIQSLKRKGCLGAGVFSKIKFISEKKRIKTASNNLLDQENCEEKRAAFFKLMQQKYGNLDSTKMREAINRELVELLDPEKNKNENINKIEDKFQNATLSNNELSYYTFNIADLNWTNIDKFNNFPENQLAAITLNIKPSNGLSIKLVLKSSNIVLDGNENVNNYSFVAPKNQEAWLVAIKNEKGIPYFGIEKILISDKGSYDIALMKSSLAAIKAGMKQIDTM